MDDIFKIVKFLENSEVLLKGVSETIQNEAKEQRGGFLSMLLGTLGASLLGDVLSKGLSGKGVIRAGKGTIRAGEGTIRAGEETIRAGEGTIRACKGTIRAGKGTIRAGKGTIRACYGSKRSSLKIF